MLFVLAVLAIVLCSCTRTLYTPVETVRTEYVETDTTGLYERLRHYFESIYCRETSTDSVIDRSKETVVLKENGDTARHDKERIVYVSSRREKELEHRVREQDSIIDALRLKLASVKSDSIPVPYPVEKNGSRRRWIWAAWQSESSRFQQRECELRCDVCEANAHVGSRLTFRRLIVKALSESA